MSSYGKKMLQASLQLQHRSVVSKAQHCQQTSPDSGSVETDVPQDKRVEEWLASCPDSVSMVSTEMITPSCHTEAANPLFPELSHVHNVDSEGDCSLDSESDEYLGQEPEEENVSEVIPNLNEELKSNEDDFVKNATLRTKSPSDGYILNKRQYCTFCNKGQLNLARHIVQMHASERDVALMLAYKESGASKEYNRILTKLRCEGNFKHNIKVLKEGGVDIVVVKRPKNKRKISEFLPCPHCCGFYYKAELWRHAKKCNLKDLNVKTVEFSSSVIKQAMLLLESACLPFETGPSESMMELLAAMRKDEITKIAIKDKLLCHFGEALLQKYGPAKKNDVAQRMRQLARLIMTIQKMNCFQGIDTSRLSSQDLICGKHFDLCIEGTSLLCDLVITPDRRREYKKPSLALRLGHLLKKLAIIKRGLCLRSDQADLVKEAKTFEKLLQDEWTDKVSTNALNTLKRRKDQQLEQLPETDDLLQLKMHQDKVRKKAMADLEVSPNYNTWRLLAQNVLARLVIFNKRRAGEVAKLTLATYKNRPNWRKAGHSGITESLQPLERKLLEKTDLVMVPGKRNRKVPILLPQDVLQAMEVLMNTREQVEIPLTNSYFFSSRSSNGYLDGWQAVHASSTEAGLNKPELVTSTKCRKYNATITQLLDLGPTEVELLANHMGHSVNIHKEHYRLQESTIEITKVGKLLLAVDEGVSLKPTTSSKTANETEQVSEISDASPEDSEEFVNLSSKRYKVKRTRKISIASSENSEVVITEAREEVTDQLSKSYKMNNIGKLSQKHVQAQEDDKIPTTKLRHRWTQDQENALKTCFEKQMSQQIYPSGLQIQTCKTKYPVLASKSYSQIKSKLQYLMRK